MLFSIYVFAFIVGTILIGASILLGDGTDTDADFDADAGLDVAVEADVDTDTGADDLHADGHAGGEGSLAALAGSWRSLRFWTFFAAFFGAAGAALDGLELVEPPMLTLGLAVVTGLVVGQGAVVVFRAVGHRDVGTVPSEADYVGKTARVLLSLDREQAGKIRLQLHGTSVDLLATTTDDDEFGVGDEALIIAMDGTRAVVSRTGSVARRES